MSSRSSLVLSFVLLLVVRKEFAGSWLAWPIAQPRRKWRERSAGQVDWFISSEHDMLDELQKGRAKSSSSSSSSSVRLLLLNFNDKKPRSIWNNRGVYLCVCVCLLLAKPDVCVCADDGHWALLTDWRTAVKISLDTHKKFSTMSWSILLARPIMYRHP